MRIPVFVSCPTSLNKAQNASRGLILSQLKRLSLEPRALGRSDYPTEYPLREVMVIAKHCSGGVILGFEQFYASRGVWKRGTGESRHIGRDVSFPTPWNHLEAGILFSLELPLLVFKEDSISGGVFDSGVTDVFVHKVPKAPLSRDDKKALDEVFLKWQSRVREHYYRLTRPWRGAARRESETSLSLIRCKQNRVNQFRPGLRGQSPNRLATSFGTAPRRCVRGAESAKTVPSRSHKPSMHETS